jgi:hypothetical protein
VGGRHSGGWRSVARSLLLLLLSTPVPFAPGPGLGWMEGRHKCVLFVLQALCIHVRVSLTRVLGVNDVASE